MPGREIASKTESEIGLVIQLYDTNTIINGNIVDLQRSNSVLFTIHAGEITDGTYTFTFEESIDEAFTVPIVIPESDLRGNTLANLVFTTTEEGSVQQVSLVNNKRFVRTVLTVTGATSGGNFGVLAIKQNLSLTPTT